MIGSKKIEKLAKALAEEQAAHQETKKSAEERLANANASFEEELRSVRDWFDGDAASAAESLSAAVSCNEKLGIVLGSATKVLTLANGALTSYDETVEAAIRSTDALLSLTSALRTLLVDRTPAVDATLAAIDESVEEASITLRAATSAGEDFNDAVREERADLQDRIAALSEDDEADCGDEGNDCSCDECDEGMTGNSDGIEDAEFTIYAEPASPDERANVIDADVLSADEKRFFGAGGL